jgi:23S rRNA (uracil1939-C5)-methyltransferase
MTVWTVRALGRRGDGILDGPDGPLYAPFTLPGERVRGAREGDRLRDIAVEKPAPQRVAPPCKHFGQCGGCALQHAEDGFLAAWKTALVRDALAAEGLETEIRPIHVSPPGARRRVALTARRAQGGVTLGFLERRTHRIADIASCAVAHPAIGAALPALRRLADLAATRRGLLRLSVTVTETGLDVDLAGGRATEGPLVAALAAAAQAADFARLTVEGAPVALLRAPKARFGRARVALPPGGFLQATMDGEARLIADVLEAVGDARRVADLFAGSGTFTLPLAAKAAVLAVESDPLAVAALAGAARGATGLRPVRALRRDLFHKPLQPTELARLDAVAFDPPRAGAAAQAAALAMSGAPRIAAVSCNPTSFARDARILTDGGYRLLWARPVDQFRWSPHVEVTAAFARA